MAQQHGAQECLLSICIPTFNRSQLLESALLSLAPQIQQAGGRVELIVSDNCSTDQTAEVTRRAQALCPIHYHRNASNIGACNNFLNLPRNLARGEFCWLLGDDDLVRPGGVAKVLSVLEAHRDLDYVFVSLAHVELEFLERYPQPVSSGDLPGDLPADNQLPDDSLLTAWEELIAPEISGVFLGAVQASVFRRSLWNAQCDQLVIGPAFSSLESTYPHLVVFARSLVGRKAYYIGEPQVIVVDGAREWWGLLPLIYLVRLHEVLDLYQSCGVPAAQIRRCRGSLLRSCGQFVVQMLFGPQRKEVRGVSIPAFLAKYWSYPELWISLARTPLMNPTLRRLAGSLKRRCSR